MCQRCSRLQEWNTAPEQNRHDQHLHEVDLLGLKQAPEQTATAKEPDLPAGGRSERSDARVSVGSNDRDAWVLFRRERS